MSKSVLTVCFWVWVLFWGGTQVGLSEDMEDRFIDPDLAASKSIFIDVKDASLVNVLKIISKQSDLSFIASQDVADKKITIYLNKVPLNQALQTVLDANGLAYEMQDDSNVFVIKAKEKTAKNMITKVYQLKYATVSSSKLNSTISLSEGAGSTSGGSASSGVSTGGLEQVIKDSLSPDGKVVEDARTNSLIITDLPGQFDNIDATVVKLDVPIPQILIEVEMIDVSKTVGDQLGISWGATPLVFTGGSFYSNFPFGHYQGIVPAPNPSTASASSSSSSSGSSSASSTTPALAWNANGLQAALNFIASTNDARTLARPRILTLNNETAKIEISRDQAVSIEQVSSSTTSGSSTNTITPERVTTGVILKVTPQANLLTGEITMAISPKVIDVIASEVQPTGSTSSTQQIFDPVTRGSDSVLKLKDGQSMVIGGLMDNSDTNIVTKLPFLGDLPWVGSLFSSTNKSKTERELIIFLTPHIIDNTNQAALKGESSSISAQADLDLQDTSDRAQDINNSLNSYEMK